MNFGETIKAEREKRGLSLRTASSRIGISHSYLASLESGLDPRTGGRLFPSPEIALKICAVYDLDISYAVDFFRYENRDDIYIFMAKKIRGLRKTNPAKYREMLNIITQNND